MATSRSAVNSGFGYRCRPSRLSGPESRSRHRIVSGRRASCARKTRHTFNLCDAFFDSSPTRTEHVDLLDEIRLESVDVPEKCRLVGNALAELEIPRQTASRSWVFRAGTTKCSSPAHSRSWIPETGCWSSVRETRFIGFGNGLRRACPRVDVRAYGRREG